MVVYVSEIVTQDIIYSLSGRAIVRKVFIVSCAKTKKTKTRYLNGSVCFGVHIYVLADSFF